MTDTFFSELGILMQPCPTFRVSPGAQHSTAQHSTEQHSTVQPSAITPAQSSKPSAYVPIRARQRKHADRVGESQHVVLRGAVLRFLFRTYQDKYVSTCLRRPCCFPGAWRSW